MRELQGLMVVVETKELLAKLQGNREKHKTIVSEARKGYIARAKIEIAKILDDLSSDKLVNVTKIWSLDMPRDMTKSYDAVIESLNLHKEPTIQLTAEQVRNFVMDKWDWTREFTHSNSAYSTSARDLVEDE